MQTNDCLHYLLYSLINEHQLNAKKKEKKLKRVDGNALYLFAALQGAYA